MLSINLNGDEDDENISDDDVLLLRYRDKSHEMKNPCPTHVNFSKFCRSLDKVNQQVYKKVISVGKGETINLDDCDVMYKFSAFIEFSESPVDSSNVTKKPMMMSMTKGIVPLPGYRIALSTMKIDEEAVFWIHSDLLYGCIGCPPRIPPKADMLIRIKVTAVKDSSPSRDNKHSSYELLLEKTLKDYKIARDYFQRKNFRECIRICSRNVEKLEEFNASCREENDLRQKYLIKMYESLSVCYDKLKKPAKVCILIKELDKLSPINNNYKALVLKARANTFFNHFEVARDCLLKACTLAADNEIVLRSIKELDEKVASKAKLDDEKRERLKMFKLGLTQS